MSLALLPVGDALALLLQDLAAVAPDDVPLHGAVGHVLAEPLTAAGDTPARAVALRAGWAVSSEETVGATSYGGAPLASLHAVRAGEALPAGTDAVLPEDAVLAGEALVAARAGENVRRAGEDARERVVLAAAGTRLTRLAASTGAAAGRSVCRVRRPEVGLWGPEGPVRTFLAAFIASEGASVVDDPGAALHLHIRDDAPAVGFAGVALRPGEGVAVGRGAAGATLLLPPRLAPALAAALILLRPCLDRLSGLEESGTPCRGVLTRRVVSMVGMTDLLLLRRVDAASLEPLACGDIGFPALAAAEAWLALPPESEGFAPGSTVEAFALWGSR